MKYHGGKAGLAKYIAPFIQKELDRRNSVFIEPFVGGCNLITHLNFKVAYLNDINQSLITMYKALQEGWIPPTALSEDQYLFLKEKKDPERPDTAFAAFGCSFGGKEWGGYARGKAANGLPRNYALEAHKKLIKLQDFISNKPIVFTCCDYKILNYNGSVYYCDPPYENTLKYKTGNFDTDNFLNWAEDKSRSNSIFLSEFSNPRNYEILWKKERAITMSLAQNIEQEKKTELLLNVKKMTTL